ncbi:hypothetical protein F2Q68_00006412 [Brassica cretica]|uniref:DUF632 domain-containing protein n=1 Tax=Brassica cretica TaxID=69181 RepID=A0A8S9J6Z8_BRACR|nr:hypothetical protein F2Q68_00006412 [Brassica cretica]
MGCTSSKLDDLPAVALCRERCNFLEAAIQQRYHLAESHVAYTHSLKGIGHSLHLFINHHHRFVASPRLNLPPQRKGDPEEQENKGVENSPKKAKLPSPHHPGSGTDSGHLEFDSDSDDDEEFHLDSDHHHHLGNFETGPYMGAQPGYTRYPNPEMMGHHLPPTPYMHMNYMKNSSMPPSVIYEQRPSSPQKVYIGESSSSSTYPYNSVPGPGPGYYGSSTDAPASKPPPPPPSPPRSNGWDFLNPFDTYYPSHTPSRDSRELREEEGIPELEEDDDSQYEVVKEVHGGDTPAVVYREESDSPSLSPRLSLDKSSGGGAAMYQTRPSVSVEKKGVEYEVHVVEKTVVEDGGNESNATATRGGEGGPRAVPEVAKEIENQFLKAAESGSEIAKLLEVGKRPYGRKHASSQLLHGVTPSVAEPPTYADIEEELASRSRNLSSTLHKLHLWEKKLYREVKCLLYEPEETADGIAPFSPGRLGAPPIFVICNQWSQALDRISEKEVIEAMRSFTTSVLQLWEQDRLETTVMGQEKVRSMDREEQRIHREIQALEKKMVLVAPGEGLLVSGNVVYQSDTSNDSLQGSLQRIFEAMERFTDECMRAYDDLLVRAEEETAPRESEE